MSPIRYFISSFGNKLIKFLLKSEGTEFTTSYRGFNLNKLSKENDIQIIKQDEFDLSIISDGMLTGREIRTVQAHYGILVCGTAFQDHNLDESERKYQKAIRITERLAIMGCSTQDNLPYFNASKHLASKS